MTFFCDDTATTETYTYLHTLSPHGALPMFVERRRHHRRARAAAPRLDGHFHFQSTAFSVVWSVDRRERNEPLQRWRPRSEEHTSELQSLMRTSYAVFCLKKQPQPTKHTYTIQSYIHIS